MIQHRSEQRQSITIMGFLFYCYREDISDKYDSTILLNSRPYGGMHGDAGAEVTQVHLTSPLRIRCAMIRLMNLLEV